jgi:hypothetical protein
MRNRISAMLVLAAFSTFVFLPAPRLRAQGSGAATFSKTFNVPASASTRLLPIPNNNQIAHSVSVVFSNLIHAGCAVLLDGSGDKLQWYTIGSSGNIFNSVFNAGTFSANGAFVYYRLKVSPCPTATTNIVYMGYATFLPPVLTAATLPEKIYQLKEIPADVNLRPVTPNILVGFQCSNPDTSGPVSKIITLAGTPTAGGINYVQADVGAFLTITTGSGTATVAITQVNGGAGVGPITVIATAPTIAGSGYSVGAGQATTGGTGTGATVNITGVAITNVAWLQLIFSNLTYTTPHCGNPGAGVFNFEAAVPAGGVFVYTGPPISLTGSGPGIDTQRTCARAMTMQGGATPVNAGNALSCNFQFNYSGPYYPFDPLSP